MTIYISLNYTKKLKRSQHVPHERPVVFAYLQNNLGIPGCVPWQPQQFIVPSGFRYFAGTLTSGGTGVRYLLLLACSAQTDH